MVDRQKAIEAFIRCGTPGACSDKCAYFAEGFNCYRAMKHDLLELLKEQPEQKHGHWISFGCGFYRCSVCDDRKNMNFVPNYCSTCGAKMDEKMDNIEVKQNETD